MEVYHANSEIPDVHEPAGPQPRPGRQPPAKLVSRLDEQRHLVQNPSYVRVVQRWTGRGDERRQVEKKQPVRPWWRTDSAGNVVLCVYYGTKADRVREGRLRGLPSAALPRSVPPRRARRVAGPSPAVRTSHPASVGHRCAPAPPLAHHRAIAEVRLPRQPIGTANAHSASPILSSDCPV